jgi:hypothetical protein
MVGAKVEIYRGGRWELLGTTPDSGSIQVVIASLEGFNHTIRLTKSTGQVLTKTLGLNLFGDGTPNPGTAGSPYTIHFSTTEYHDPTSGTLSGILVTLKDEALIEGGNATEIFTLLAKDATGGNTYNDAQANQINSIYNSSFDDPLTSNETNGKVISSYERNGILYHVYDYESKNQAQTAIKNLVEQKFNNNTDAEFEVTENIPGLYYHALSRKTKSIAEVRGFISQKVVEKGITKPVYRVVLAIQKAYTTPVLGGVEVWLELDGRTIRMADDWNGTNQNTVHYKKNDGNGSEQGDWYWANNGRNYLGAAQNNNSQTDLKQSGVNNLRSDGAFDIPNLALDRNYTLKIRATDYTNFDVGSHTLNKNANFYSFGEILLTPKKVPEWMTKELTSSALLQGLRLRLGADYSDASSVNKEDQSLEDAGYTQDGIPLTQYS